MAEKMQITRDFIPAILQQIEELLKAHIFSIDEAYQNSGEDYEDGTASDREVKIALAARIAELGNKHEIETGISFIKSKIKDKVKATYGPEQLSLFAKVEALRPKKGSGVDSVTFETPGHEPVTLHAKK
jgi:hypothetical protein